MSGTTAQPVKTRLYVDNVEEARRCTDRIIYYAWSRNYRKRAVLNVISKQDIAELVVSMNKERHGETLAI